jgi:proteasome lid subunit RPN8/RPN11
MATLHLPAELRTRIERWVAGGYPLETCGLLLGSRGDGEARVCDVAAARNLNRARARDRYELDPLDFLAADRAARSAGLDVIGAWHSHPDHPAVPSETDRAQAWEGWSYLIVSVAADGVRGLRAWRMSGDRFVEEEIEP